MCSVINVSNEDGRPQGSAVIGWVRKNAFIDNKFLFVVFQVATQFVLLGLVHL